MNRFLVLSCTIAAASLLAPASPVFYNMTFMDNVSGTVIPTGSFTYDSSAASNPFASFIVNAGGLSFDFTSKANNPMGDTNFGACWNANTAAGFFNGLTGSGCTPFWKYFPTDGSHADFVLWVCDAAANNCSDAQEIVGHQAGVTGSGVFSQGNVSVTTPEPGALYLTGLGALLLIAAANFRRLSLPISITSRFGAHAPRDSASIV